MRAGAIHAAGNLDHRHNGEQPHIHHGYFHNENDGKNGSSKLTEKENKMVDRVVKIWNNYKMKSK